MSGYNECRKDGKRNNVPPPVINYGVYPRWDAETGTVVEPVAQTSRASRRLSASVSDAATDTAAEESRGGERSEGDEIDTATATAGTETQRGTRAATTTDLAAADRLWPDPDPNSEFYAKPGADEPGKFWEIHPSSERDGAFKERVQHNVDVVGYHSGMSYAPQSSETVITRKKPADKS